MKTKKLVRKMKEFLNADRRAQLAKSDSLEKVLEKLAAKADGFNEKLNHEEDEDRRLEIRQKLKVIEAQRRKGEKLKLELESQGSAE